MLPSLSRPVRRLLAGAVCAASLGLAAACGSAPAATPAPPVVSPAPAAEPAPADHAGMGHGGTGHGEGEAGGVALYAVQTGPIGIVVTDGQGRLVYGSAQDANDPPTSRCTGTCAQEWLPLVVPSGQEPELLGVPADKVGRMTRDDGSSQLTLGGWPVYVNTADDGGDYRLPADAHGAWFVLTPQGEKKEV